MLDSAAVVAFLDGRDALHGVADDAIRDLMVGHRFYASAITFSEVMTGAYRSHHDESMVRGFFADLVSEVLVVDAIAGERAARLRADHKSLRLPDALILAAADRRPDVEILLTGDGAMASIKGLDCRVDLLRPPA